MPVIVLVGAALLGLFVAASDVVTRGGEGSFAASGGYEELESVLQKADLSEDWKIFLLATAWGESKWNSDVGLGPNDAVGRPPWLQPSTMSGSLQRSEAQAAKIAYDRNKDRLGNAYPESMYTWGSGGYFGLLPANAVYAGFGKSSGVNPWGVAEPDTSVVMAMGFAKRLMGWNAFRLGGSTWLTLRTGWGDPGSMADVDAKSEMGRKFDRALDALGVPRSWKYTQVKPYRGPLGFELLAVIEGVA